MFRHLYSVSHRGHACCSLLPVQPPVFTNQTRNTFVLRRRNPPDLARVGSKPPKMKNRHFIYDLDHFSEQTPEPDMSVILTKYVSGVGDLGDTVTMRPLKAYYHFLLIGLAVYNTPENAARYIQKKKEDTRVIYSSPHVQKTITCLRNRTFYIPMNPKEPWVLEPWHIKIAFRNQYFMVPESAITMPPGEIRGPDTNLENKDFFVTMTINNKERVYVRCRIFHWTEGREYPKEQKLLGAMFPEQEEILKTRTLPVFTA